MSENSTTMLMVKPARWRPSTPARKDAGIAIPMKIDARKPSANRMTMATSSTPVATEFCRSPSICRMILDLSWVKVTWTAEGQVFCSSATTYFTASTVSMRFAPVRLDTSTVIAGRPLTRVTEVASLNVGFTCAISSSVTAAFAEATTGIFRMSWGVSKSDGTLTAKRPVSPSSAPAAMSVLNDAVSVPS
jgi:hypothetical protein